MVDSKELCSYMSHIYSYICTYLDARIKRQIVCLSAIFRLPLAVHPGAVGPPAFHFSLHHPCGGFTGSIARRRREMGHFFGPKMGNTGN